ncbi:MAG: agmatinase family protein [Chitinophagaceae bacterium]|nr:agmatinase family protein [Chitinophagaceae bacterium]
MDLSSFDPNSSGNPNYNIFGLPFSEEEAKLILLPVPWEVTVSYLPGTARAPERIKKASLHVDLLDPDVPDGWKQGFHLLQPDRKILFKSDYLRKESELFMDFISKGQDVDENRFMCKALKEVNEGSAFLNAWVYDQTRVLLEKGKLVGLLGGDHSVPMGFYKAIAEKHGEFGILQIDAHSDLRKAYQQFTYSHASIMYNALNEIPQLTRLVQVGVRDYSQGEWEYICNSANRVVTYFDKQVKERMFEGLSWRYLVDEMINHLPQKVYISFDIDGLNRTLCPHTGTPVPGGLEVEQVFYLFRKIIESGRRLIGFDLCEVGISSNEWDENVGARVLFKLCNLMVAGNQ